MKILITIDFFPEKGGIQRYLASIVERSFTDEDIVLIGCHPDSLIYESHLPGKHIRKSWFASRFNKKLSLCSLIAPYLNIIHYGRNNHLTITCGNIYSALIPWFFSFFGGNPYSIYTYGTEIINLSKHSLKNILPKSVLSRAKQLYVLTDYFEKVLRENGYTKKISKMSPRIKYSHPRVKTDFDSQKYRILTIGRLVPHKGHDILIEAASLLSRHLPWSMHIIGNGPEKNRLNRQILANNLRKHVFLYTGLTDSQVQEHYSQSGIFVLPSLELPTGTEGFGLVLLDAMINGLAIIASAAGGIPEVISHGQCGLLVPPADPRALSDAICYVWNNPQAAQEKIQTAHKHVTKFTYK